MSHEGAGPLLEAIPYGALIVDRRGSVLAANQILLRSTKRTLKQIEKKPFFETFDAIEDASLIEAAFLKNVTVGGLAESFATRLPVTADAEPLRITVHLRSIRPGDDAAALILIEPIVGDEELARAAHELDRVGVELARIKHEISNPLMGLIGSALLLEDYPDLSENSRHRIACILDEGRRIEVTLRDLGKLAGS